MADVVQQAHELIADRLDDFHRCWYFGPRFQYRPIVGYTSAPFKSKTLNIGEDGFRGGPFVMRSANRAPRVGCFGASSVMGIPNCADNETVSAQLARDLGCEVLNFGVPVYNSAREANAVLRGLLEFDLSVVVLTSGFNDFHTAAHGVIWDYEDIAGPSREAFDLNREKPIWHIKRAWRAFMKSRSRPVTKDRRQYEKQMSQGRVARIFGAHSAPPIYDYASRFFATHILVAADASARARVPFLFVAQANIYSTSKQLSAYEKAIKSELIEFGFDEERDARIEEFSKHYRAAMRSVVAAVRESGGAAIDADDILSTAGARVDVFHDSCHLTAQGCFILAQAIRRELAILRKP